MVILDLDAGELVFGTGRAVVVSVTGPAGHAVLEVGAAHVWHLLGRSGALRWPQPELAAITRA